MGGVGGESGDCPTRAPEDASSLGNPPSRSEPFLGGRGAKKDPDEIPSRRNRGCTCQHSAICWGLEMEKTHASHSHFGVLIKDSLAWNDGMMAMPSEVSRPSTVKIWQFEHRPPM